jgi:hypothetical protein
MVPSWCIYADAFSKRLVTLLGSTHGWEDPSSLLRWHPGSLEHLHGVFSGPSFGRLFLRSFSFIDVQKQTSQSACRVIVRWANPFSAAAVPN